MDIEEWRKDIEKISSRGECKKLENSTKARIFHIVMAILFATGCFFLWQFSWLLGDYDWVFLILSVFCGLESYMNVINAIGYEPPPFYREVTCPYCGKTIDVDYDPITHPTLTCPYCNRTFNW